MKKLIVSLFIILCLCGCGNKVENKNDGYQEVDKKVTVQETKDLLADGAVLIDVRTNYEYIEKHIDGAELLSLDNINEETVKEIVKSKETVIIVYCQSGNRSSQAVNKLNSLGYSNVYDLGSINNWVE